MPQTTTVQDPPRAPVQIIALDSRKSEQVVSDKQYLKILQLTDLLSRSLELEQVLMVFSREIAGLLAHSGYSYSMDSYSLDLQQGAAEGNKLAYHLTIENMDLGELCLYRQTPFSSNEVCQFEDLLGALVYPLRNALMYFATSISAYRDPLTGTHNRAAMEQMLPREIRLAQRHQQDLSLMVIDLDGFKRVNDLLGHQSGDQLLRAVSRVIQQALRDTDILFRYGGDEFVAVLPHTCGEGALEVGDRVLERVAATANTSSDEEVGVTVSIGISSLQGKDSEDQLFARADMAMYQAKRHGKNRLAIA